MSPQRPGAGPMIDDEPQFESDFNVSDEALNARPGGRPKAQGGSSPLPMIAGGIAVVGAIAVVAFFVLRSPSAPDPEAAAGTAIVDASSAPEPEAKPDPTPEAKPELAKKPDPVPEAKPAPEPEAKPEPVAKKPAKRVKKKKKKTKKSAASPSAPDHGDATLDSALEKLGTIADPAPAPAAVVEAKSPGDECDAGKAKSCVSWGKSLVATDFTAALAAFAKGCALGSNSGCSEAAKLSEKSGGGEQAREYQGIACGRGSASACRSLANLWRRGVGGPPDLEKAKVFDAKACELGDKDACVE